MPRRVEKQEIQEDRVTMLRKLREDAGLSREQLCARLDNAMSLNTLARWENYGIEPSLSRKAWHLFSNAVGVPFEKLPMELSQTVVKK